MKHEAMLYQKLNDMDVRCGLCAHRCLIHDGDYGICGVRRNDSGTLHTLVYGESIAAHVDPIEKKPLYHFHPGTKAFSIATIGCNFRCQFCQNWQISQMNKTDNPGSLGHYLEPEKIVEKAVSSGSKSIAYTYTEPTIFFEYAYDTAKLARKKGLWNVFVTNGYMTSDAITAIRPFLDAANIDLKSFRDNFYKKICKARLQPVLDAIQNMYENGIHIEITTLIVPKENDSDKELQDIADFIASIDKNIPWHLSRYHADYRYDGDPFTPETTMLRAKKIAKNAGIKHVHLGNM